MRKCNFSYSFIFIIPFVELILSPTDQLEKKKKKKNAIPIIGKETITDFC